MTDLPPRMQALLRRTAELEKQALDAGDPTKAVRQRLLGDTPRQPRGRLAALAFVAAAIAVIIAALAVLHTSQPPLGVQFDDGTAIQATTGMPLAATHSDGAMLRFTDGSSVRMHRNARASITDLDSRGATIAVEGSADVFVQHRESSRWTIAAGPFAVRVTGTRFDVAWDESTKLFKIRMVEGTVRVSGCSLTTLRLSAPQSMEARCGAGQAEITMREAEPLPVAASAAPEPSWAPNTAGSVVARLTASPLVSAEPSEKDAGVALTLDAEPDAPEANAASIWRKLAADGRFREAYAAAESEGFDAQCERSTATDLLALADGARFAGRSDRARTVLLCVRRRFAGSAPAAVAAFRLGTMAVDQAHAYGEASAWLRTYLQEQPAGTFAREASGRLIEVEEASGNMTAAQEHAHAYLRRWPSGPHAALARSLVGD